MLATMLLLIGCASHPIVMSEEYLPMTQKIPEEEAYLESISQYEGSEERNTRHASAKSRSWPMGSTYKVFSEKRASEKHKDEARIDSLLAEAKRRYPNMAVSIRNATNEEIADFTYYKKENEYDSKTKKNKTIEVPYTTFKKYRIAGIVNTKPPAPIVISFEVPSNGRSREELCKKAHKWLIDRKYDEEAARIKIGFFKNTPGEKVSGIQMQNADIATGQIRGIYIFWLDDTYMILSDVSVNVLEEKIEVSFNKTRVQRGPNINQTISSQSVADGARAKLADFSEEFKNHISLQQ